MNLTNAGTDVPSSVSQSLELKDRRDGSSSSTSFCSDDRRRNVTRAGSDCSIRADDDDGESRASNNVTSSLCAEALRQDRGAPEAEYNLSPVHHQDLVSQQSGHQPASVEGIDEKRRPFCVPALKETVPTLCEEMLGSNFAREARGQLRELPDENACRVPEDDPTFALQDRLQKLLLTTVLEHEYPVCSGRLLEDAWDSCEWCRMAIVGDEAFWRDLRKEKQPAIHTGAHRRELSLEDEEMRMALLSEKNQICFCCRRHTKQTPAEEMYCKETIRQIMQQVQGEIEQWSYMQDIVHTLQEELEGWSKWQKLWQDRALQAEAQLKCLQEEVREWKYQAQSSNEELVVLRCEKQILKNKIEMMEEAQCCVTSGALHREVEEKPRCASVGTQHEEFALCESFVHSRNESGRSSVDLGAAASTQRSFRKVIKKSLDFATGKSASSHPSKFSIGSSFGLLPKSESNGMIELSGKKKNGVCDGKPMVSYGRAMAFNTAIQSSDSAYGHGYKGRKKARLFSSKENKALSTSLSTPIPFIMENAQEGVCGHVVNVGGRGHVDCLFSSNKPKSSLPSAPASTPSRTPFGDMANLM